jgi:hypothetical protein
MLLVLWVCCQDVFRGKSDDEIEYSMVLDFMTLGFFDDDIHVNEKQSGGFVEITLHCGSITHKFIVGLRSTGQHRLSS